MGDLWGIGGFRREGRANRNKKKIGRKISIANLEKKYEKSKKKIQLEMV